LGSFVLDVRGHRWACDLGPDEYGIANYFDPTMRPRLYRTASLNHNTLVIDGACQPAAVTAPITGFWHAPDLSGVVIDLSAAYPVCARVTRGCALSAGRHVLIVDEIVPGPAPVAVAWQMHTGAAVTLAGATAVLALAPKGAAADTPPDRLQVRALSPSGAGFAVEPATPTWLPPCPPSGPPAGLPTVACENPNTGIVRLVIRRDGCTSALRLAVLLSPDASDESIIPERLARPLADWPTD
jgi:hypothetical protein